MSAKKPVDRSVVPAGGSPRPFSFPQVASVQLANGLKILSVRMPEFPLVAVQMLVPAGGLANPMDRPGLADVHGSLLEEGTKSYTSSELALAVEQLGGSMETGAGWNVAFGDISVLASSFDHGLDLISELILGPTFPEEKFDWVKERALAELMRRPSRPSLLADDVFSKAVYDGTVYGFPVKGTPEGVGAITLDEVKDFHHRCVVPEGSKLIVAGDFDPDHLHRRAEELFGGWVSGLGSGKSGSEKTRFETPIIEPVRRDGVEVFVADRSGAAQTQIQVGHAGVSRSDPEFHILIVLNVLLGGKFTSRLNLNLRERHGYTYGVQSSFARRLGPGPFTIRTAVATDIAGAAVKEILFELHRLCEEPIPDEEVRDTLDYLRGVFPYTVQTTDDVAGRLENLAIFDLPLDYYDFFARTISTLTAADLEAAARKFIHPDRLVVVAAGPADELVPQLEPFGSVTVVPPAG